jgi:hypothetical protein
MTLKKYQNITIIICVILFLAMITPVMVYDCFGFKLLTSEKHIIWFLVILLIIGIPNTAAYFILEEKIGEEKILKEKQIIDSIGQ